MNTKTRLKRIEDQARQRNTGPTAIRVHWPNELEDPNGRFFENEHGHIVDRETGEVSTNVIRLEWPAAPDLAGNDND